LVENVTVPFTSGNGPSPTWTIGTPGGDAIRDTSPVAVVGVTLTVKVAFVPCAIGNVVVLARVVADAVLGAAEAHAAIKFVTFTEPSPVARSYPAVALNAGVVPPVAVARIPN
jgi:hypothetical protein